MPLDPAAYLFPPAAGGVFPFAAALTPFAAVFLARGVRRGVPPPFALPVFASIGFVSGSPAALWWAGTLAL